MPAISKTLRRRSHYIALFCMTVLCCIFLHISSASAKSYIGFGIGPASTGLETYEGSTAVRLYAGSRFARDHGIEVEITQADYSQKGRNVLSTLVRNRIVSYVYNHSMNDRFSLYGKAGINFWKIKFQDFGNTLSSKDGTSLALGGGITINVSHSMDLRLEYQRFDDIDITEVSQITLTGVFNFGRPSGNN